MLVVRTALRALRHGPGFTATAIAVLGLGLGANTILFNAVNALLWRPLPFENADRLLSLQHHTPRGDVHLVSTGRDAADIRDHVPSIAETGLVEGGGPVPVALDGRTIDLDSAGVNSGYLRALGVRPVAGRLFGDDEDYGRGGESRAILAASAWRRHFGADAALVGRSITVLDGAERRQVRIVGVYADDATLPFASNVTLLTPIAWRHPEIATNRSNVFYRTVLRVKPGVDPGQASAQVAAVLTASQMELPKDQRGDSTSLVPLRSALVGSQQAPVWLLYAAAGLLLALTTINAASLFLARALGRRHETAVRTALGASLGHTLRVHFAEALLVCAGGLGLALVLNDFANSLVPEFLPELRQVGPELLQTGWVLLVFGVATCLVVACALTALPVILSRRTDVRAVLAEGGRLATHRTRWQAGLTAAQIAVILVLLTLGGLVGRSFVEALRTDPGFDASGALTFRTPVPGSAAVRTSAAYDLAAVIASTPGTAAVGFSAEPPLGDFYSATHSIRAAGFNASDPSIAFRLVNSGYFDALGARLVRGRVITEAEVRNSAPVAVLNESASRLLFERGDPVGRQVHAGFGPPNMLTVIGVIKDIRTSGLDVNAPPMLYRPYRPFFGSEVVVTVRTTRSTEAYLADVEARARRWNAAVVVRDAATLDRQLRKTVASRMHATELIGGFGLLGLLIGSVGLYGTVAAQVERRRREFGIHLALGASTGRVMRTVLAHGAQLVTAGALAGLAVSAVATTFVRKLLYGVQPWDGASFVVALILLAAGAYTASLVPAVRASRIDPAETLRDQ